MIRSLSDVLSFWRRLWVVRSIEQIISAHIIKIRNGNEDVERNTSLAVLIIRISPLRNIDVFADIGLRKIVVFS